MTDYEAITELCDGLEKIVKRRRDEHGQSRAWLETLKQARTRQLRMEVYGAAG